MNSNPSSPNSPPSWSHLSPQVSPLCLSGQAVSALPLPKSPVAPLFPPSFSTPLPSFSSLTSTLSSSSSTSTSTSSTSPTQLNSSIVSASSDKEYSESESEDAWAKVKEELSIRDNELKDLRDSLAEAVEKLVAVNGDEYWNDIVADPVFAEVNSPLYNTKYIHHKAPGLRQIAKVKAEIARAEATLCDMLVTHRAHLDQQRQELLTSRHLWAMMVRVQTEAKKQLSSEMSSVSCRLAVLETELRRQGEIIRDLSSQLQAVQAKDEDSSSTTGSDKRLDSDGRDKEKKRMVDDNKQVDSIEKRQRNSNDDDDGILARSVASAGLSHSPGGGGSSSDCIDEVVRDVSDNRLSIPIVQPPTDDDEGVSIPSSVPATVVKVSNAMGSGSVPDVTTVSEGLLPCRDLNYQALFSQYPSLSSDDRQTIKDFTLLSMHSNKDKPTVKIILDKNFKCVEGVCKVETIFLRLNYRDKTWQKVRRSKIATDV